MFCPVCGAESTQGLNYCKRCGAGLTQPAMPSEQKATSGKAMGAMMFLIALVSIAGFIALFATIYNLGERPNFDTRALIGIMAFGGATVVGVIGLMVWLILRIAGSQPAAQPEKTANLVPRERIAPQLPAPPVAMPSVTENTTRNFEPRAYKDRGTRE